MKKNNIYFLLFITILFCLTEFLSQMSSEKQISFQQDLIFINEFLLKIKAIYSESYYLLIIILSLIFLLTQICFIPFMGSLFAIVFGYFLDFKIGTIYFSIVATFGYTFAFLIAKKFLKSKNLTNKKLMKIVNEFNENGLVYFFTLRLSGVIPAVILNMAMGATNIKTRHFLIITYVGILPYVFIYNFIGAHLGRLEKLEDLLTFKFSLILFLASIFPILINIIIDYIKSSKKIK